MSILSNKTEKKAIKVLANALHFFSKTDLLFISNEDAVKTREAENILRGIIENNGYKATYAKGRGIRLTRDRTIKVPRAQTFF